MKIRFLSQRCNFAALGGLSLAGDKLYIADTNNHSVRVPDLKTEQFPTLAIYDL